MTLKWAAAVSREIPRICRGEPRNLANGAAEFGKIFRGKLWSLIISNASNHSSLTAASAHVSISRIDNRDTRTRTRIRFNNRFFDYSLTCVVRLPITFRNSVHCNGISHIYFTSMLNYSWFWQACKISSQSKVSYLLRISFNTLYLLNIYHS